MLKTNDYNQRVTLISENKKEQNNSHIMMGQIALLMETLACTTK